MATIDNAEAPTHIPQAPNYAGAEQRPGLQYESSTEDMLTHESPNIQSLDAEQNSARPKSTVDSPIRAFGQSFEGHARATSLSTFGQQQRPARSHTDSTPIATDSMITVPLSDSHRSVPLTSSRPSTTVTEVRESQASQGPNVELAHNEVERPSSGSSIEEEVEESLDHAVTVETAMAISVQAGPSTVGEVEDNSSVDESKQSSFNTTENRSSLAESVSSKYSDQVSNCRDSIDMSAPDAQGAAGGSSTKLATPRFSLTQRLSLGKIVTPIDETPSETSRHFSLPKPDIFVNTDVQNDSMGANEPQRWQPNPRRSVRNGADLQQNGINRMTTLDVEDTLDRIEEREEDDVHGEDGQRTESSGSRNGSPVDWEKLDKTEEHLEEQTAEESGDETALLLARLEQENQALATDPKALQSKNKNRKMTKNRPPSIADLKSIIKNDNRKSLALAQVPQPPPMTELDFWAALVRDYPSTAQRLPTLTSNKIRAGIPPPLRGVVWVSMAGARDQVLEMQYDRLCGEQSPYGDIISKDIGRSFPGVEMFRDSEGEGQQMLGRVLKCFSLHDPKIGYCQGLGFLVGPLLMQMGERDAFCVLVRLMEDYDLHSCFQPDLSGLHLRIYQFQALLHQHLPELAAHLDQLQIEAAYLSQWFLSFFAVTCPLPMLFRIYDVIFAEGASETIMRVALSVMRKNQQKILAIPEFEDVMQLLLSRALWDPYGLSAQSADDLVNDFVGFTSLVTRENLKELDEKFKAAQSGNAATAITAFFPDVQQAASRFLGRLWAPTGTTPTKTTGATLSPHDERATLTGPPSLKRTPSKLSLASTYNSVEAGSDNTMSSSSSGTTMTDATSLSRLTSDTYEASLKSPKPHVESMQSSVRSANKDKNLHTQIEDLLTALSEMQREHAQLAAELAKEREEREEDGLMVRGLLDALAAERRQSRRLSNGDVAQSKRRTAPARRGAVAVDTEAETEPDLSGGTKRISQLVAMAEYRFPLQAPHNRRSTTMETKADLRSALALARTDAAAEQSRLVDMARQLEGKEQELLSNREELREARMKIRNEFGERQKLEKTIRDLRSDLKTANGAATDNEPSVRMSTFGNVIASVTGDSSSARARSNSISGPKGLRDFKLGRSQTMGPGATGSQIFNKRSSSLAGHVIPAANFSSSVSSVASVPEGVQTPSAPASPSQQQLQQDESNKEDHPDRETLLLELVNAKTAEAVARQELEEIRGKFDAMRKLLGGQPSPNGSMNVPSPVTTPGHKPSPSEGFMSFVSGAKDKVVASVGGAGGGGSSGAVAGQVDAFEGRRADVKPVAAASAKSQGAGGGGWGGWGWGKRVVT